MSDETAFGRKVHKPDVIVNDNDVGLLATDETMTNEEFLSVFYNTGVFNENSGKMVFDSEVINKFKRVLAYQDQLEPIREKLVTMQFEKYFESEDVDTETSKFVTISLLGIGELEGVTVFASEEDGEYVYILPKVFKRMLKMLKDDTIRHLRIHENVSFISLRLWAFDNDFDMVWSDERLEIQSNSYESEEETAKEKKQTQKKESRPPQDTLTEDEYYAILNTEYIESGEDINIQSSVIAKLKKLIANMEAIKPLREQFAYQNVKKFIDLIDTENIDKLICDKLEVCIGERTVGYLKVYNPEGKEDELYVNLFGFKQLLMRAGSYYAIYLRGDKNTFVSLKRWTEECCAEIRTDKTEKTMKIIL